MTSHAALHPRLGAVDHISCHLLRASSPESEKDLVALAHELGNALGADAGRGGQELGNGADAGRGAPPQGLPVWYYGSASPTRARLRDLRRALGYFRPSPGGRVFTDVPLTHGGTVSGVLGQPDAGPSGADPRVGVCLIGATPWVVNYNIGLRTNDVDEAKRIARKVVFP